MGFKQWLETFQPAFPLFQQDDDPDFKKINRYKNKENYVNAMSKGGKQTELAAKTLINKPANLSFNGEEKIIQIHPNAFKLEAFREFPERYIAFVHLATVKNVNPMQKEYDKPRHRILAFWQGQRTDYTAKDVLDEFNYPVGGISFIGGYIDTVWVDAEFRNYKPSLYKALREFARKLGIVGLKPGDDLTSKSFRASQAKYDWDRAKNAKIN